MILLGTRVAVTAALLGLIAVPEVLNESARLLVLGAIVGHWLGHSGEADQSSLPSSSQPTGVPPPPRQRQGRAEASQ